MLALLDEYTRGCLAMSLQAANRSEDVLQSLADVMVARGAPGISAATTARRSARAGARLARAVGAKTLFIEPGSPWENGYNETFNGKLRDELLRPYGANAPAPSMTLI